MKRLLDLVLVLIAMPFWLLAMLLVMVAVRFKLGAPIFFSQTRPGLHGKPFTIFKFRTMTDASKAQGQLLTDAERLTDFGRFLRSSSLDELPEIINVLRGEMSLVGPRPLLMKYLPRYTADQARRHDVKPGITGWAQINGRNAISWEERFALDVWYVDHWNLTLDARILCRTLRQVLKREGISQDGHVTMTEFLGNQRSQP